MEFIALVDKLDDLLADAKRARFSSDLRVDKQAMSTIVGQLRGAIPDELREAHWIRENREEMLAEAKREAARIREEASEEKARLLARDVIGSAAEVRARQVLEAAEEEEREIRLAGEQYALEVLEGLEAHFEQLAAAVARGRERLGERRADRPSEGDGDPESIGPPPETAPRPRDTRPGRRADVALT